VRKRDLVAFFRSFATLVAAGVDIRRCLDVTLEQCGNARLREALASAANDLENGLALSEALARRPNEFPKLFVTMIKAGEAGGALDDVLMRIASVLEQDHVLRGRVVSSLAYPAIVAIAAAILIVFLITAIVPAFQTMYDQMHVPIPWITQTLIALGTVLRDPIVWAGAGLFVPVTFFAACYAGVKTDGAALEEIVMRVPLVGPIAKKVVLARLTRMLGTLLRSGVGLVPALDLGRDIVKSAIYRRNISEVRDTLAEGSSFSQPLAASGLYEPMFVQLVRVGEETGALDAMLLRIAEYYDSDVHAALSALGSILEPVMILLLGGAVGFIVAAVFIPLYTLIGSIK
jgi:type IV pilus assembly protein PilC